MESRKQGKEGRESVSLQVVVGLKTLLKCQYLRKWAGEMSG